MGISDWELIGRLVLATGLGGLIGLEREVHNHPAGLRTHILVCLGSALVMLVSMYGLLVFHGGDVNGRYDAGRIAAQVVSGIGFLGAGTIMREGSTVRGLTTAASLWIVAAIGLAVGSGMYVAAVVTTAMTIFTLRQLNRLELRSMGPQRDVFSLRIIDRPGMIAAVASVLAKHKIDIRGVVVDSEGLEDGFATLELSVVMPPKTNVLQVVQELSALDGVVNVRRGTLSR
ncbi:MAG: MgtC/SapB family protein [Limnochordales bacterium]|nr:hypothetical protein [Bacillota bacterium]